MKTKINNLSVFILTALFAVSVAWSATRSLENDGDGYYINLPVSGTDELTIPDDITSFKLYDDGGYSDGEGGSTYNCSGKLKMTAPTGRIIQVAGTVTGRASLTGHLYIYDGTLSGSELLYVMTSGNGTNDPVAVVRSTENVLTVSLSGGNSDLELEVTVLDPSVPHEIQKGSVIENGDVTVVGGVTSATINTQISLELQPDAGYLPAGLNVVSSDGVPVKVDFSTSFDNAASFSMPYGDATITPFYTNDLTADGGLFVNIPVSGTPKTITIPNGVTSFKLYDDGGADSDGSVSASGTVVLNAPTGKILKFAGSANGYLESLNIYDGENSEASILHSMNFGSVEDVYSGSNVVAVALEGEQWGGVNIDFTVYVVDVEENRSITDASGTVSGGSVSIDKSTAQYGDLVTLSITPDEGYFLGELKVVRKQDGKSVEVTKVSESVRTFKVQDDDVVVSYYFANPKNVAFDEDGGLKDHVYFHMECENSVCTISQKVVEDPYRDHNNLSEWKDFKYWYRGTMDESQVCEVTGPYGSSVVSGSCEFGLVDMFKSHYPSYTLKLADTLRFGGYKNGACSMQFNPIPDAYAENSWSTATETAVVVDGNGYAIDGLCQIGSSSFGFVNAESKPLTISNVTFTNAYVNATGSNDVGVVAGKAGGNVTIKNVKVENATVIGAANVGGFVGNAAGLVDVQNSSFDGNVTGSDAAVVGGLVGYAYASSLKIQKSFLTGDVAKGAYVGGFVGRIENGNADGSKVSLNLRHTYSIGDITTETNDAKIGYLIGSLDSLSTEFYSVQYNYHYGTKDAQASLGIGSFTVNGWHKPTLWDENDVNGRYINRNIRNAVSGLDADGDLVFGIYPIDVGTDVDWNNGVVSGNSMKRGKLAVILNMWDGAWTRVDGVNKDLPFFADANYHALHIVAFEVDILQSNPAYEDQKAILDAAVNAGKYDIEYCGSGCYGLNVYTDYTGTLKSEDLEFVNSLLDEDSYWYGDKELNESTIFGSDVYYAYFENIKMNVVYHLCTGLLEYSEAAEGYVCVGTEYEVKPDQDIDGYDISFLLNPVKKFETSEYGLFIPPMVVTSSSGAKTVLPHNYQIKPKTDEYSLVSSYLAERSFDYFRTNLLPYSDPDQYYDTLHLYYDLEQDSYLAYVLRNGLDPDPETGITPVFTYDAVAFDVNGNEKSAYKMSVDTEPPSATLTAGFVVKAPAGYKVDEYVVEFGYSTMANDPVMVSSTNNYLVTSQDLIQNYGTKVWTFTTADTIRLDSIYKAYALRSLNLTNFTMKITPSFDYVDYMVNFIRPIGDNSPKNGVSPVDVYIPDSYVGASWEDSKTYSLNNTDTRMPVLYAAGGCIAWSDVNFYDAVKPVYSEFDNLAVQNFESPMDLYPVYFTKSEYEVTYSDWDSKCGDAPTESFTVTAHAKLNAAHLTRMELWQIIGAEGENSHADTIKHVMTQDDQNQTLFTLEIPKVTYTDATTGDESAVSFTFEAHAVPAEGYAVTSNSYYAIMTSEGEGGQVVETRLVFGDRKFSVSGNYEFNVDLIGGESYNYAFDTENWDYISSQWGDEYYNVKYELYVADADLDLPESYVLGETALKLPMLYATTMKVNPSFVGNANQSFALVGWTIYADSAYCVVDQVKSDGQDCIESDSKNLFKEFSGDMVVAIQEAVDEGGFTIEENTVPLYPVWGESYDEITKIKIGCPNETEGCGSNDHPMSVTLSQTFNIAGKEVTLTHSSDEAIAFPQKYRVPFSDFTLDVSFTSNPGYEVGSIKLEDTDLTGSEYASFTDGKLHLQNRYFYAKFVPHELSYIPYTLTFDISSLDSEIVAFGQSWYDKVDAGNGTAVMNVGTANEFPNLYALHSGGDYGPYSFNEVYWVKEQAPEDETEWNAWYGTYISSSMKQPFNSDLVTQYFGENSTETAMAAYPMVVSELTNGYDARDAWPIWFRSDNDSDPKSYHGSVVISQTWNGKTYKQKSQFTSADAHTYLHRLFIPKADDTLVYNVSLEPDPGYAMTLKDYIEGHPEHTAFGWSDDDGGSADLPEGEDWGYNLDPEVMTLKVQPSRMSSWANEAYVSFTVLHYNVEFSRPTDAEVFVASKWVSDNKYEVDWFESQTDVTVNNIKTPILYDENGCQVYWKVKDSEAHVDTGIVGELVYMTSTETLETAINVLVPDTDESNRNCDNAETYKQTLTVEGEGTILLEQVIGDAPESPEDPAQVVLAHSFVEDEATGVLTLNVPAAYNEVGPDFLIEQTGVKFRVVAVPAENYTLDKISYETAKNGNVMTVTVEDSAEVNVMESLPWTVKFKSLAPIYVTYDLSLGVTDSADTYLPTNATKSEKLELANNADTVVFWKPYRASTCFQGWSTTAAANYTADDSAYTTFNAGNFTEFSTNPDNPTTLYAIWGDDCPETRNIWTVENGQMNATLVLYQLFGDDTLFHEVLDRRGLTLEGDSFDVYIDPVRSAPKSGYHYAADAKYELSYRYTLPVTEGSNPDIETVEVEPDAEKGGVWHLTSVGIPSTPTYTFTTDVEMMSYLIVFDVNAGDAPVFYGTDWVKEKTLTLDSGDEDKAFPQDLRRTDACFEGWVIPGIEEPEIYSNFDEVVDALKDVVATVETVQNDEGESVDHTYYTLSAQWNSNCTPETFKIFSGMTEGQGTFQVSQNPDAENAVWMEVPEDGLVIPELEGLSLAVKFTGADTYETGDVITGVKADAENAEQLFEIENGESFTVAAEQPDVKLNVEANLIEMNFALDAGYDDVFYGPGFSWNWSSEGVAFGAALPSNLYRAGYKFAGWKFDNEETPMLNLNEDVAAAYNAYAAAHEGNYPDTLHAVWTVSGVIPAYSLQLTEETLEQNAGVLTLSQTIGDSTIVHVFEDGMLDVPMVEDLALTVNFAIDTAHSFDGETPITLKSIITDETVGSYATGDEVDVHTETLGAAGTVMVNVATKVDSYEFAFDINVGEDDQVFYGKDWFATKSYDMSEEELDSKFPTSAYQTQNCLGGFAFTAMEPLEDGYTITMPDVKFYTGIDSAFIADYKALEEKPTTLYAVWLKPGVHCSAITSNVMISALNASEEGEFTLTNADMEIKLPASEETAAVQVPVAEDLEFTVTFTPTSAYDFDAETGTITISLVDGYDYTLVNAKTYSFAKNATLKATPTLKAVAFDLNANAGEASVFYGKEYAKTWTSESAAYGAELPKNIYRTDANLLGWAFEAIEDDAAEVWFTKFDKDFMDAYAAQETAPTTLYAVWKTNAERATYTITSTEETLGAGNLVVAQWAFADSIGYAVGADGLKVPAENNLIFRAYFEPLNTHSVVGDLPVALDVDGEVTNVFVGQDFVLAGNTEITVATENDVYVLAFDANAGGATLFYGDNWFSGKTYSPADAEEDLNFPTSLYRTDKCLDGFAFNADESVVYKSISDEFITEFKERELTSPVTLVAVWKNCPETYANYTVAAKDASEGVFTLTNKYGEIANKFEVGSEALVIPAAEDLTFSVTFAENVTVDYENKVSVLAGDETVAMVADGATVSFSQNSELKAVASVLGHTFAFDANKAANDTVFYNSEWSATKSYDLADEEFDYHFPTAYQTSKCLAGFAFSKTATESEAFQEVGTEFIKAYKALEVKPTTLYAVWTTEDCNHGYVVLRSGNTEAEGSFTISDAVNSYELSAGSLMAVPTHVVDFKVTFHEGHAYELENIDLLDDNLNSYSGFANGAEYSFDMNTVLKANVEPKSKGLVFALNADDATVFYGTSYDPKWFENLMNGDFYNDNLPSGIYRNDAVFVGWSFTQMSGVAEGSKYFTKIDDDFYEAFKNHAETRENFDTPDTLYAVWKSAPNREIYTVTVGNKASEGKFRLTNASGGLSNEFLVDATTMLVIPAENDLVFTVSFVSASETAEYEGISVISTTGTQIAVIEMGDEYTFRKDVMLRAISYMPTMEFALDVNAGDADVFYESDFGFKWWASSYGQNLPTGIYRTDAKLVGWSLDKNATPDKAFKEIDDAFNEAVASYMENYGEDLIGDISEGDFDLSKIQEMYGMDFAQMSRGPVLYAVWEKANVKTVSVKSNSLRQGTLTLQQLVDDSTFTFVVGEKGLKVPYVEGGLEFRAHFEANESHLLNSGKSLVWNAAAADTTKNDEFVLVSEATSFDALVKVVGFNLAFNAESKETLFYGDDWTSGKKVIAKGTSASQFPTMVYSASRCLVGWTLKTDAVAYTEMQDELANKLYEKYPKLTDTTKINMYALWSDSPDQCSALMTRVSVEQDKGEVMLVEKTGESTEVVHKFNEKGSMMLPSDIVSAEWTLRSAPDSSYALDSLTIVRNDKLLAVLREGGNLPGNMDNAVFKAHFSKANKTPVEIVERHFAQSGNAIQLNIKASEFEVTRGVEARVRVFDVKGDSVVLDSLLGDSVAMGFESEVVLRMKRTGDYKVVLTLEDEKESDAFEQEFGVKSSIASVGKDGWQMVSLAAVDTSAINWTSDDQVFYWWDEFGNGGDYWQYRRYNRGDSVVATRGAWYSSLDSLPLVLKRDIEDDGEDAVWKLDSIHSGWNLVANTHGWEVSLFAGHADEEKDVDEESEISFYRYNSETADYEETKYLKPYEAVWAKVGKKKNWKVSAAPVFAKATEREPQPEKPEGGRMLPKRVLAKASTKDRWVLQAVLSDKNGKQDAWNILGAGNNPFSAEEPPESMGDHVNLSIVEGKRALAKSIKSASDEMEWTVALSASNDRVGYLTFVGIDDVNAFGYRVFVTVDGNTTEMKDGVPLQVLLKSNAKTATVRVAPAAKVVAQNSLKGLRSARLGGKLKVSFETTGLAGTNARVDLLDMKGHVMSTVNAKTLEGTNALVLDAPKSGLYMLRVRAGSQQQAAKVMVK